MSKLPTTIEGIEAALANFRTDASDEAGRKFKPRPTDVFIATYPKCGTTWVQQIVHSLRTQGDTDYDDISAVVPWIEMCLDLEQDPNAEQKAQPRAFKSHFHGGEVPKGAKYINVVRDPKAVLVSFYKFFEGWYFEPGSVTIDEFAHAFLLGGSRSGRYWDHVVAWWHKRNDADTLLLDYESMAAAPEDTVRRIAGFIGFGDEEGRIQIAIEQSSLAFMSANGDKYDDKLLRSYRNEPSGLPKDAGSTKVRSGESSQEARIIGASTLAAFDEAWTDTVTAQIGIANYDELREAMNALSA